MLVLSRKTQEQIHIGDKITITIVRVKGQTVRVGIEAPKDVRVIRGELQAAQNEPQRQSIASHANGSPTDETPVPQPMASVTVPPCHRASSESTSQRQPAAVEAEIKSCVDVRRRIPGASLAPLMRRPQRLGPAWVGALMGRMR